MINQLLNDFLDWLAYKWVHERSDLLICTLLWIVGLPPATMLLVVVYVSVWNLMWFLIS